MRELLRRFWFICVLRDGPQHLPAGKFILQWSLVLNLLLGTLYGLTLEPLPLSLQRELALLLVNLGFVRLVLMLNHHGERFRQTAAALLGTDVIIIAIGLAAYVVLLQGLQLVVLWNGFETLLMVWSFLVAAHIFRHALGSSFALGMLLSFLLLLTSLMFWLVVQELMSA